MLPSCLTLGLNANGKWLVDTVVLVSTLNGCLVSFNKHYKINFFIIGCLQLRTEALASLHSSFPSNQGMPLAQLEDMLAMEVSFFMFSSLCFV